jgi:hypothetical protein
MEDSKEGKIRVDIRKKRVVVGTLHSLPLDESAFTLSANLENGVDGLRCVDGAFMRDAAFVRYPTDTKPEPEVIKFDPEVSGLSGTLTGRMSSRSMESVRVGPGLSVGNAPYMPAKGDTFQIRWLGHHDRSYLTDFFLCQAVDAETVIATMHNATGYRNHAYVFRRGDVGFIKPSEEVVETYRRLSEKLKDE